jgi:formate dehydrogenase maturation protein FdhE
VKVRGGPADFDSRRRRALDLADSEPAMRDPLRFAAAVHSYQQSRVDQPVVVRAANRLVSSAGEGHRLTIGEVVDDIVEELVQTRAALIPIAPARLGEGAVGLGLREVNAWTSGGGDDLSPAQKMWIQMAAAPIVEGAAEQMRLPTREAWSEPTCPLCGDCPQVSVIVEESGEFMRGSPRYLVCGRCAAWWVFSRAVCPGCGEHHPDRLVLYSNDRWPWARVDSCSTCRSFIKTFDLRQPGAVAVVPLIDDLATLTLDFFAIGRGLSGISRTGLRIASTGTALLNGSRDGSSLRSVGP